MDGILIVYQYKYYMEYIAYITNIYDRRSDPHSRAVTETSSVCYAETDSVLLELQVASNFYFPWKFDSNFTLPTLEPV